MRSGAGARSWSRCRGRGAGGGRATLHDRRGAETSTPRRAWWLGLRSAEQERYAEGPARSSATRRLPPRVRGRAGRESRGGAGTSCRRRCARGTARTPMRPRSVVAGSAASLPGRHPSPTSKPGPRGAPTGAPASIGRPYRVVSWLSRCMVGETTRGECRDVASRRGRPPYHMLDGSTRSRRAPHLTHGQERRSLAPRPPVARPRTCGWPGIGSSWHAALVGELMLARIGGSGVVPGRSTPRPRRDSRGRGRRRRRDQPPRYNRYPRRRWRAPGSAGGAPRGDHRSRRDDPRRPRAAHGRAGGLGCHTVSYTSRWPCWPPWRRRRPRRGDRPPARRACPTSSPCCWGASVGGAGRALRRTAALLVRRGRTERATAYEAALKLGEAAWAPATGSAPSSSFTGGGRRWSPTTSSC